ncbi:polysaccharide deacetylase family protein, partial [Clostridium perfringens]|nr:polysaccharide deacetylase family protein [Clostridium perfringens]
MRKIKHKGFLIALVSALIISSSFIACDMKGNKSNVESEKANLENNTQKDEASSNKENSTDNTSEKSNSNAEATKNRFEGLKTTSKDMNIPVLCYHDVTPNNPNNNELLVNPEKFKEQLQYLKDNNYTPITLDELYDYLRNNKPIPEKSVVIT